MSNVKRVEIIGELPFNATDHYDVRKFFGQMNGPAIGLKVEYGSQAQYRPNSNGGKTAYYNFCISGEEAVSDAWLANLIQALVNCGASINTARCQVDEWRDLNVPQASADKEFVCELRFTVHNSPKPCFESHDLKSWFESHDLEAWLKDALVVSFNLDHVGMFHVNVPVSAGVALNTLCPA